MPKTVLMMGNSQRELNLIGEPCKADGWFNHVGGLHTVVMQVVNFTGRLSIEASLELDPSENDWFVVKLDDADFIEFPLNPYKPTGDYDSGGDSATIGFTFKVNALWLRAKLDRTYISDILYEADRLTLAKLGNVVKITLAR